MAGDITNYQCPACTGPLHFVGASGKLECDYCGSSYEVAEVEAMMEEKTRKALEAAKVSEESKWNLDGLSEDWGNDAAGIKMYSCPSCGAELICDENTAATCCPYCGNQTVVPGQFDGALKPEYVIPFKTDKEGAIKALKEHYKGKKLLPNSFASGNHIEEIQGVYVPFWMFDCEASGEIEYAASTSTTRREGNKEITTTKHYEVLRSGNLSFEKVPVDASKRMPDGHMDSIEPYDYAELKDFSMAYMPGFLAEKYDETAEDCGSRMQERCERSFEDEVDATVTGYTSKSVRNKAISVKKGDVHYAMLPVWLLATKWQNQDFLFAMNGQTGKLVGDLPVDKGKYWKYFGGISVVLILLMQLFNNFCLNPPMTGGTMAIVCIGLPLLIALIACSIMKSSMKSVVTRSASAYIAKGGLKLRVKQDTFLRTTVKEREIQSNQQQKN